MEDGEWDKATCGDGVVDDGEGKGRHGRRARAVARHVRPVDVAVRAPPAPVLRRRAAAAAAASAEPVPGDAIITRGVVVRPARAVVPADGPLITLYSFPTF